MPPPPRDKDGRVVPHDDQESIPNDALLVRNVHEYQDNPDHGPRPSSGAFSGTSRERDPYEGMSVAVLDWLQADNIDPRSRLGPSHIGAVLLRAGDLRDLGLIIGPDPTDKKDPYHASVWGVKNKHRKKIRDKSRWVIAPVA